MKKLQYILGLLFVAMVTFGATDGKLNTTYLYLKEASPGENTVRLKVPSITENLDFTLPANSGSSGYILSTNGSGVSSWINPSAGGTVTSVDLTVPSYMAASGGPITSSGVINLSFSNQSAGYIFAGPASGSAIPPTFRVLSSGDIPSLDTSKITTGKGTLGTATTGVTITSGSQALFTNALIDIQNATGAQPGLLTAADWTTFNNKGTGSVTSVTAGTGLTGGPVTTTGSLYIADTGVTAGTYGAAATVPVVTVNSRGQLSSVSSASISIGTSAFTGTLGIANGGTGQVTKDAAFDALAPTTSQGDLIIYSGSTNTRLASGTNGQGLIMTGGSPAWAAIAVTNTVTTTGTTYTASTSDNTILTTGSISVNLYTAVGNAGRTITVKKTDSSLSNIVTIDPNGSQTADGFSTLTLNTQYEQFTLQSDNSNWLILSHTFPEGVVYAGTLQISATTTAPTKPSTGIATDQVFVRRSGPGVWVQQDYKQTASTNGTNGTGDYIFTLPSGLSMDTTKLTAYSTAEGWASFYTNGFTIGICQAGNGSDQMHGRVVAYDATHVRCCGRDGSNAGCIGAAGFQITAAAAMWYTLNYWVPILNWSP